MPGGGVAISAELTKPGRVTLTASRCGAQEAAKAEVDEIAKTKAAAQRNGTSMSCSSPSAFDNSIRPPAPFLQQVSLSPVSPNKEKPSARLNGDGPMKRSSH
jgi:hypothetical protein